MLATIDADDPQAVAVVAAIRSGNVEELRELLHTYPHLATGRIQSENGETRTLLHVACDWPGHFPNTTATLSVLIDAGADVDARFKGSHGETPLHWAASSDDVEVLDALLDAGADIEAPGGVIAGGSERGGQHRVPTGSRRHQLDVGVEQRVTDPDHLTVGSSRGADQARHEPQRSLRSQW